MNPQLSAAEPADYPFLREMLYEAVFWRERADKPTFEEALALPYVGKELADWGKRDGDAAVIARIDSTPVGASWYRFWTADSGSSGYVDDDTPVLALAVRADYRRRGVGRRLLGWLLDHAARHRVPRISLSVSKDNGALRLYRSLGFEEHADRGDAFTMVRRIDYPEVDSRRS